MYNVTIIYYSNVCIFLFFFFFFFNRNCSASFCLARRFYFISRGLNFLSDTHGRRKETKRKREGDLKFALGPSRRLLTTRGERSSSNRFVKYVRQIQALATLVMPIIGSGFHRLTISL